LAAKLLALVMIVVVEWGGCFGCDVDSMHVKGGTVQHACEGRHFAACM
jgi:hypothetical protein